MSRATTVSPAEWASSGVSVKVKNEQHAVSASASRRTRVVSDSSPASTSVARVPAASWCSTVRSDAANSASNSATRSGCSLVGSVHASTGTQSAGGLVLGTLVGRSMTGTVSPYLGTGCNPYEDIRDDSAFVGFIPG
jgi:hypothetical protein